VAVHINAFNFPVWGLLEKFAPTFLAGMPCIGKPATATSYLTEALVRMIDQSGILPKGALQLVIGSTGDLLDRLDVADVVTFTGSADTAAKLRVNPNVVRNSIPFNAEADSLNCARSSATRRGIFSAKGSPVSSTPPYPAPPSRAAKTRGPDGPPANPAARRVPALASICPRRCNPE
jgi:hypothetical protein